LLTNKRIYSRYLYSQEGLEALIIKTKYDILYERFYHILNRHLRDFEYLFGISDHREIAELIFETIKNNEIIDIFSGGDPQSQNLVYKYRVSGNNLYVVLDADGYILTAYPSRK